MRNLIAIGALFMLLMAIGFGLHSNLADPVTAAPPAARTVLVVENQNLAPGMESITTAFVATDDCAQVVVFVDSTANMIVRINPSVDGVTGTFPFTGSTASLVAGKSVTYFADSLIAPFMAVEFARSNTAATDTINTASLFCDHEG